MANNVILVPSSITYLIEENESLLAAATRQNIVLEHSCGTGQCGACKAKVLVGQVEFEDRYNVLTSDELASGVVLTCVTKALSPIELEAEYHPELAGIVKKTVPCKVADLQFPVPDVAVLRLRLPPTAQFQFLPGQFIDLSAQGVTRSYSVASAGIENNQLELHIRQVPGGQFSDIVFNQLKPEQLLRLHGPHGTFFVRHDTRPLIFLAGGTGFAPVKAMVEDLIARGDKRPVHIYWGQRTASAVYSDLASQWAQQHAHIQAHIVVSDDPTWSGRRGLVHEAVLQDFANLAGCTVYACGSSAMIAAAKTAFLQQGLEDKAFHSDAFLPAVTLRG